MSRVEPQPLGDLRLPLDRPRPTRVKSTAVAAPPLQPSRFARYFVARGWLHFVLLTGVAIFVFPFIWLVATSLKTDEELTDLGWMPSIPHFVPRSPYVLPQPEVVKPMEVDPENWTRAYAPLMDATRAAIAGRMKLQTPEAGVDPVQHRDAAAAVVMGKLVAQLNTNVWSGTEGNLREAYRALLTPDELDAALDDRLARVKIGGLLLRTLDGHTVNLCAGRSLVDAWKVESGRAELVKARDDTTFMRYAFDGTSSAPIVLRFDFDYPADPADLHKLIFSLTPDNSWHALDATLDVGGNRWVTDRTNYLAQNRPGSILFQPPTFEDDTFKARTWTPLKLVHSGATRPENGKPLPATLRLTITPSSTLGAVVAKVQRNYSRAFNAIPFWRYVGNSLLLVALTTIGTLFSSTFVAYAFARLHWPGRTVAFLLLLSTMMLPGQVTMIPSFMIWRQLGWYNTLNPLWVPSFFGGAFFIFLMVQHMKTIPRELEEAARIDGLNAVQTWWYIILPLVKPAAAAIAIMTVMGSWNEFMGPLIYLRDQSRFPLSLGLFGLRIDAATDWTMIMAGNVLMTLPVIVLFIVFQKYFVQGMTMSGMKG